MAEFASQGSTLGRGDAASPEVYTTVGEVVGLQIGDSRNMIPVTSLADSHETVVAGLASGSIEIELNFDVADAAQDGIRTDKTNGTNRNWRITLATSPQHVMDFSGVVEKWDYGVQVDDKLSATATIRRTSAITES